MNRNYFTIYCISNGIPEDEIQPVECDNEEQLFTNAYDYMACHSSRVVNFVIYPNPQYRNGIKLNIDALGKLVAIAV